MAALAQKREQPRRDDVRHFLETIDRLGDLHVIARTLVDGLRQGRHATPQRGGSTEFFDYRMYVPGDDARRVDWKLYGRTDRLYVRRHRRFADLTVQLIVDCSASMGFVGAASPLSKYRYAAMLAAALAMVTVRQGDRAALALAGESIVSAMPAGGTMEHLHRIIHELEGTAPAGLTRLPDCLLAAQRLLPQRRVVVILSDFLVERDELRPSLHPMAHAGCDVVALQVLTAEEMDLRGLGGGRFVDDETGLAVRSHAPSVLRDYQRLVREHTNSLRRDFHARGMGFHQARTTDDPVDTLRCMLRLGGLRM
ncbi:MAG: DUF58 domain-containing protein [Phycisphaerales bacterium]|nr:DUF58 domain-containing protein [Phycisphaerales bacterium]